MNRDPILFVVAGPTCAGKTTVMQRLDTIPMLHVIHTTVTTRPRRPGEVDGVHYYFWTTEQVEAARAQGELVEYSKTHGNLYATPRSLVPTDRDAITVFDVKGARMAQQTLPRVVTLFLDTPLDDCRRRLMARPGITPAEVETRMETARWEVAQIPTVDYLIPSVDGHVDATVDAIRCVVQAERLRVLHARTWHKGMKT